MSVEVGKAGFTRMSNPFISEKEHAYWEGVASRQAEIDELQAMYGEQELYAFELQKRIDGALRHVVDHGGYDDLTHVIDILKGNQNEK